MPARRRKPTRQIELMIQYKIRFLRYQSQYPREYRDLFDVIKRIKREEYRTYQPNDNRDETSVAQMRMRVYDIVRAANQTYNIRVNEETLRMHIEHLVFQRFDSEAECHKCRQPLWVSEYTTRSALSEYTDQLQSGHTDRTLCRCTLLDRFGSAIFTDNANPPPISDRCSTIVQHDRANRIMGFTIPTRRPDRVFGLTVTDTVRHYVERMPDLKHTPFSTSNDIVYPFFISEAKPGTQNPGFQSIDTQTAFPIRSCLMLQKRLREASNMELYPLVWYMAYIGDTCILAAGVTYQDEVRVYSLWKGSLSDPDDVLRLLLIVDYIVDWARITFKNTILACLARGWDAVERQTPAEASQTTSLSEDTQDINQSPLIPQEQEEPLTVIDAAMDDLNTGTESDGTERGDSPSSSEGVVIPHTPTSADCYSDSSSEQMHVITVMIRNACLVKFEFVHVTLPETETALIKMLQHFYTAHDLAGQDHATAASELLNVFCSGASAMPLSAYEMWLLRNEWLRKEANTSSLRLDESLSAWTWIRLDADFDPSTWHVVRRLTCISCSNTVAAMLARIAGQSYHPPAPTVFGIGSMFDQAKDAVASVRCLPGTMSAQAALQKVSHDLCFSLRTSSFQWCGATDRLTAISERLLSAVRRLQTEISEEITNKHTRVVQILPICPQMAITRLFISRGCNLRGDILLRKPRDWPSDTEEWCLMQLEEEDPDHEMIARGRVEVAIDKGQVYMALKDQHVPSLTPYILDEADKQSLGAWARAPVDNDYVVVERATASRGPDAGPESMIWTHG